VVFLWPFSGWPVISIQISLFAYSQALHTIHRRPTERQIVIRVVHVGEAAELLKAHNKDREATAISSVTWKIVWKKDSWDRANGIDRALLALTRLLHAGAVASSCNVYRHQIAIQRLVLNILATALAWHSKTDEWVGMVW